MKENDKTQLFVNGVEECVAEYMAKSAQNILLYILLRFPLYFAFNSKSSSPFTTLKELIKPRAFTVITLRESWFLQITLQLFR